MANDLDLPSIADGQADGQWQSSNDADAAIANAVTDVYSVDFSSGSVTLTATQYRSALIFKPSAALAAARTLTLPAVKKPIWFRNGDATYTVTLKSTDGGSPEDATTIDVGPGDIFFGYTNGSSPGLFGSVLTEASGGDALPVAYDVPVAFADAPDAGALIHKVMIVRDVDFSADFSGSSGHVGTNPDATFDVDVKDDGSSIGTISVSTSGTFTFTTTSNTAKTVAAGSRLEFYAPSNSPAEATIANFAATLKGLA